MPEQEDEEEQEDPLPSKRKNKGVHRDKYIPHDFKEKTKKKVVTEEVFDSDNDNFVLEARKKIAPRRRGRKRGRK
jgi:hypothetical protein